MSENHKFCCKCDNPSPEGGGCSSKNVLKSQSSANVRKTENTGSSSTPTFEQFQTAKTKERAVSFRPAKRKTSVDTIGDVAINFGIMLFDGNQLKPQRPDCRVWPFSPRSRVRKSCKISGQGSKNDLGAAWERPRGGSCPKL